MFLKNYEIVNGERALRVTGVGKLDLTDTLECGQAFRYELITRTENYVEYLTVVRGKILRVGQERRGELIFYGLSDEDFENIARPYFALDTDYEKIREDIVSRTDSEWLKSAADAASGIVILGAEPWETLFSFIVSQNNNIPRIRKIIRKICAEYGENLARREGYEKCPLGKGEPCNELCRECGVCYAFPTPSQILDEPEKLLPSHPGFRYKYLLDAALKVADGTCDLEKISEAHSYEHTMTELKKILGVGDKVASCAALFGFGNLEAFPIDVWMKRAIDTYFDGSLDPTSLGAYAGVAQQYIFHYIRNLEQITPQ